MNPVSLWNRLNPFSSQTSLAVKAEEGSNEMVTPRALNANPAQEGEEEDAYPDAWSGFGDEELGAGEAGEPTISSEDTPTKKKKKKKRKRTKNNEHTAESVLDVQTSPVGNDHSPKTAPHTSPLDEIDQSMVNGHLERIPLYENSMLESSPVSERSKEVNGVATKKRSPKSKAAVPIVAGAGMAGEGDKSVGSLEDSLVSHRHKKIKGVGLKKTRSPKSKAAAPAEDDSGAAQIEGSESAGLWDGPSESSPKTKHGKLRRSHKVALDPVATETEKPPQVAVELDPTDPQKSSQAAFEAAVAEPEITGTVDADTTIPDLPTLMASGTPHGTKDVQKDHTRVVADEPSTKSQQDDTGSDAIVRPRTPNPVLHTAIKRDTQEDSNLDASAQLRREAHATVAPPAVNSEVAEVEPKQISTKASGKRKAVDESLLQPSNKKAKRFKDKAPPSRDLGTYGFLPSDRVPYSPRGSATSNTTPMVLIKSLRNLEEHNHISLEQETPSHAHGSVKSPWPLWNAVNNPVEPDDGNKSDHSLFIPDREDLVVEEPEVSASKANGQEHNSPNDEPEAEEAGRVALKAKGRKRNLPIDAPGPSNSTPSKESRVTPAKSRSKTPKTQKGKATGVRAVTISKVMLPTNEVDAITAAVESYQELLNVTKVKMNQMIQSDASGKFAQEMWKAICDEVPDIPRRRVMNTCRRKFHNFEARGSWTEEQNDELKIAYDEHPGKWKLIGETLNRFPEDCRDRWRNYLVCGDTLRKDAWDLEEEKRLRAAIKQCVEEARGKSSFGQVLASNEETFINWQRVSELMDRTRSRLQCRDKWMKLKDREEPEGEDPIANQPISTTWRMGEAAIQARLFSAGEKLKLLKAIRDSGAVREGKIPWLTLKKDLNGEGKRMGWKYCFRKLREHLDGHEDMEFKDVVANLVDVFQNAAPNEPEGFDIPIETFTSSESTDKRKTKSRTGRRKLKESKNDETDDEPVATSSNGNRRFRDRMLQEGETATSQERKASIDIVEDVVQGFESIKRTPKSNGNRRIRKSKRNQALSEEKVVQSDDEDLPLIGANEAEMSMDYEESHHPNGSASAGDEVDAEDNRMQEEEEDPHVNEVFGDEMEVNNEEEHTIMAGSASNDEELNKQQHDEEEDFDMLADGTNYHPEWSPDLDTPVKGHPFPKKLKLLDSPIHFDGYQSEVQRAIGSDDGDDMSDTSPHVNGYHDEDMGAVSSDDDDMSSIHAFRRPRMESIEL